MSKAGLIPVEYKVIVLPDPIEEKAGEGVIIKAETTLDTDKRMQTRGTLIDYSDMAFEGMPCKLPKRGDRIEYAMYSGQYFEGDDGQEYIIMNDKDIVGFWG
ncbi:MAG: hypothetical protein GY714_18045 [Desulfobacterales bacterium]|nr:hypothetical protein [Desulfobacterales bacterium]